MSSETDQSPSRNLLWPILLAPFVLAWLVGQAVWWGIFRFPYGPQIAFEAARFGQSIAHGEWSEVLGHIRACKYYPPLYEFMLGVVHAILGFSLANAIVFNALLCLLGALAIYLLARKLTDSFGAAIAVLLFLGHGMVFALARIPVREMAITTTTAWVLYVLTDRTLLRRPIHALMLALLYAVGMLVKWTFPLYTFIPAAVVLIAQLIDGLRNTPRGRWRAPVLLASIAVLCLALMAPWYLGVLDLKYLAASAANDPTPGTAVARLLFYGKVLGTGSVAGLNSTFVLLALTLPAVAFYRRKMLVPALSLFSGLFLLFVIVHKEERYILGSIPAMMALAGMSFSLLPRRLFVRLPLFLLVAAAATYNYVHLSFIVPKLPQASGSIDTIPSAACLRTSRETMDRLLALSVQEATRLKRTAVLAWHPLNRNVMTSDHDLFQLAIWDRHLQNKIFFAGYDLMQYTSFVQRFANIDVLVVADNVWHGSDEHIKELMKAWLDFRDANWEVKTKIPADPRHRAEIEQNFNAAFTVDTGCFPTLYAYVRK